jgi:mRNA turnover protein 4
VSSKNHQFLLFTKPRYFDAFVEEDFARAGAEAPMDIAIPAGQITDLPGSIETQLRKLGLPTRLERGKSK